ncbi:MarR family protein [Friedmanniella luteola]|uniref:MarR family protein n=1 Tax=Friedmanniella luteola TaxID=546871 RepID=A0A1H1RCC4_9ACTN|nr:MarR family transcriptional regulator [Friedmanniella luteola]SDS33176.1 MarR family protein [Friedmanniella luteola]
MTAEPPTELLAGAATELAHQGFPAMPARVIMALTASEEGRLTAEELATRLTASPAAISGAVRYLGTLGFIRAGTLPGSRRHVYTLPHSPWYTATLTRPGLYRNLTELLAAAAARMGEDSAARDRIEEMVDFFRFFERRMPELLEEWHQQRPDRRRAGTDVRRGPAPGPPTG